MAEPGGNLDRERLIAEVLEPLRAGQQGSYRLFDCRTMALVPGTVPLPQMPIILLEGSYSCHPDLWNYCALHAFVDVEPAEQLRRKSWKISKPDGSPKRKPILHISRSRNGAR